MGVGVMRLILAALAVVMILCVSIRTDPLIVVLVGIALVVIRRTWRFLPSWIVSINHDVGTLLRKRTGG